ncbi:MAG: hypothetical protein WBK55_03665 [Alphaproteobacteria bacterium]
MSEKPVTISQTIDLRGASPRIQHFVIEGYPGCASRLDLPRGIFVRESQPGSLTEGPISRELLPIQAKFLTGEKVIVDGDPPGRSLVVRSLFETAAQGGAEEELVTSAVAEEDHAQQPELVLAGA